MGGIGNIHGWYRKCLWVVLEVFMGGIATGWFGLYWKCGIVNVNSVY